MAAAAMSDWVVRLLGALPSPVRRALDAWSYRRAQQRRLRRTRMLQMRQAAKQAR